MMMADFFPAPSRQGSGFGSSPIVHTTAGPSSSPSAFGVASAGQSGIGSASTTTTAVTATTFQPAPLGPLLYDFEVKTAGIDAPATFAKRDTRHDAERPGASGLGMKDGQAPHYKLIHEIQLVKSMTDHHPGIRIDHEHTAGVKPGPCITALELPVLANEELSLMDSMSAISNVFLGASSTLRANGSGATTPDTGANPSASGTGPRQFFSLKGRTQSQTTLNSTLQSTKQSTGPTSSPDQSGLSTTTLNDTSIEDLKRRAQRLKGWRKPKQTPGTNTSLLKTHVTTVALSVKEHNLRGPEHPLIVTSFTRTILVHAVHSALKDCIFWLSFGLAADGKDIQITCHAVNQYVVAQSGGERIDILVGTDQGDIVWLEICSNKYERFNKKGSIKPGRITSLTWVPDSPNFFLAGFSDGAVILVDVNSRAETGLARFKRISKDKASGGALEDLTENGHLHNAAFAPLEKDTSPGFGVQTNREAEDERDSDSAEGAYSTEAPITTDQGITTPTIPTGESVSPSTSRISGWNWSKKLSKVAFGGAEGNSPEVPASASTNVSFDMPLYYKGVSGSMQFSSIPKLSRYRREEGCTAIWLTADCRAISALTFGPQPLAFSRGQTGSEPLSNLVAVGSDDGYIRLVDFDRQQLLFSIPTFFGRVRCLAFTPDSRYLLAGCTDDLIPIISLTEGRIVARCEGHSGYVRAIALDMDNSHTNSKQYRVTSVGEDRTIAFWEFSHRTLGRHNASHNAAASAPSAGSNGIASNDKATRFQRGRASSVLSSQGTLDSSQFRIKGIVNINGEGDEADATTGPILPRINTLGNTVILALSSSLVHTRPCVGLQVTTGAIITSDLLGHLKVWSKH